MNGYKAANHDFTIRHALENVSKDNNVSSSSNTAGPKSKFLTQNHEHLWNTATNAATNSKPDLSKSRSEPSIGSGAVLQATNQFVRSEKQKEPETKSSDSMKEDMFTEQEARQLVGQFCTRFPSYKSKLAQQFPEEWLSVQHSNKTETRDPVQIFQLSQLERSERERIIQELYEYGQAEEQK